MHNPKKLKFPMNIGDFLPDKTMLKGIFVEVRVDGGNWGE